MKKSLLLALVSLFCSMSVQAGPAYPGKRMIKKSDGTQVMATFRGDEHFSYYETDDGLCFVSKTDGTFKEIASEEVREIWSSRLSKANAGRLKSRVPRRQIGVPGDPIVGKKKGLVILVEYPDKAFSMDDPKAFFQRFFNEKGYFENGMTGSVRDYFYDQSYGQLDIDFTIAGPVMMKHNISYYGAPTGDDNDSNPAEMIQEACEGADPEVNFSDYDWDGDGEVDQVFVIYSGYGQDYESWGVSKNTIWPHESHLKYFSIYIKLDGVMIDTYGCTSEMAKAMDNDTMIDIIRGVGSACHEFSHCLGLPDFYDVNYYNYGMGDWDVMDSGSTIEHGYTPPGYTSYERMFAGWLTPTELSEMTRVSGMKPLTEEPHAYILYNEGNKNEYYLLENRQPIKWDSKVGGHGLLVLHVFYDKEKFTSNSVNVNSDMQCMTVIPANNSTRRAEGMTFPGSLGVTSLTNYTIPAAKLYNKNIDGTYLMSKPLDNIAESEDGLISFVACRPELGIPEPDNGTEIEGEASFTIKWNAVEGATGYELEVTELGPASDNPSEALQREYNFEKVVSKSAGLTDISSKMSDYGLAGWKGSKLFTSPEKLRIGTSSVAGYVRTETWDVTPSSDMTIVIGAKPYKEGTPVKGKVVVAYGNNGESASYEEAPFELTKEGYMIFSFTIRKDLFWIEIRPESCMYMNYLSIYDGIWTAEQLGMSSNASRQHTPKRAATVNTYQTSSTSYTLKDLNKKSRFIYKIRSIGEDGIYSQWSEEKTFRFSNTSGIIPVINGETNTEIYDLHGRSLGNSADALPRGIYIIGGKKVVK